MFLLGRGGGSRWLASRLLECSVCVWAPQLCQEPSLWFLTTEPGAGPCPSPWPLSPGPAGTKGPALGYTELRDKDDPYRQRILGATERPCQLITRTLLLGLGSVKPVPPAHSQVTNKTSLTEETNGEYLAVLGSKLQPVSTGAA